MPGHYDYSEANPLVRIRRMRQSISFKTDREYLVRISPDVKLERFTAGKHRPIRIEKVRGWHAYSGELTAIISRIVETGHTDVAAMSKGRTDLRYACDIARNPKEVAEIERLYKMARARVIAGTPQSPQRAPSDIRGRSQRKAVDELKASILPEDTFSRGDAFQGGSRTIHGNWDDESFEDLGSDPVAKTLHPLSIGGASQPAEEADGFGPDELDEPDVVDDAERSAEVARLQSLVAVAPPTAPPTARAKKARPTAPKRARKTRKKTSVETAPALDEPDEPVSR